MFETVCFFFFFFKNHLQSDVCSQWQREMVTGFLSPLKIACRCLMVLFKGALCSFGEDSLIRRGEKNGLIDFFLFIFLMPKQTRLTTSLRFHE